MSMIMMSSDWRMEALDWKAVERIRKMMFSMDCRQHSIYPGRMGQMKFLRLLIT
jgi:hypothetical protein